MLLKWSLSVLLNLALRLQNHVNTFTRSNCFKRLLLYLGYFEVIAEQQFYHHHHPSIRTKSRSSPESIQLRKHFWMHRHAHLPLPYCTYEIGMNMALNDITTARREWQATSVQWLTENWSKWDVLRGGEQATLIIISSKSSWPDQGLLSLFHCFSRWPWPDAVVTHSETSS